jgi:glycosyltransferase involved in cell wall biosynthesis
MKILYIIGGLGVGGAERQLLYLVEGIARRADVTVVSLSGSDVALLPEFKRLARVQTVLCPKRPGVDPVLIPRLVAMLRRERPAIVHTFLRTANYWGRVAACLAGIPIRIASERNIEIERGGLANLLDRILSSVTDRVVVNATAIQDYLVRREKLDPAKVEMIHNGAPVSRPLLGPDVRTARRELGLGEAEHLVAFIGRLAPQKNPGLFLEMARAVLRSGLKCGFLLVGDGPLRVALTDQARTLGIQEAVRFTGVRNDVPRILRVTDLLVLTSDWEGLPNVILEALAAGVPAVATNVGGVGELLADGVTGYVISPRDLSTLVNRVIGMLNDKGFRAECGRRGQEYVQSHFSISVMVDHTVALYNTVLRSRGLPELRPV